MTHQSEAVMFHCLSNSARFGPRGDLIPRQWVVVEHTSDLEKRDPAATKYIGSVTHLIEGLVIDCRGGRKIKENHGHFRPSYNRKDSGRQDRKSTRLNSSH